MSDQGPPINNGKANMSDSKVALADIRDRDVGMFADELVEKRTEAVSTDFLKKLAKKKCGGRCR